jgi:hypothetical protein
MFKMRTITVSGRVEMSALEEVRAAEGEPDAFTSDEEDALDILRQRQ